MAHLLAWATCLPTTLYLVVTECFRNQILCISTSYIPTTIVILYKFNIIDSLATYAQLYYLKKAREKVRFKE